MTYLLNTQENKELNKIKNAYYMCPTLSRIDNFVTGQIDQNQAWKDVFNQLHEIIVEAYPDVTGILTARLNAGEIKDIKQANKSVAGNTFSFALLYVFLNNKIVGNIKPNIFITSERSKVNGFEEVTTIRVGEETQKPDCDLIIYTLKPDFRVDLAIILSLKTSLRERAAQTYKWKLLMEVSQLNEPLKRKYDIVYNPEKLPLVCFATINFYNEINNPQQRGMFKFFDRAFIAKNISEDACPSFVYPLSTLIDFVNNNLSQSSTN